MTQLTPDTIPQVALEFMNDDHQEAVTLMGAIITALESGSDEDVSQQLQHFYTHNQEHFAREEEQMIRFNFPPYGCHKGEHERVLEEMRCVEAEWTDNKDRDALKNYLKTTVVNWFINHINTMDTVTAMFISRQTA